MNKKTPAFTDPETIAALKSAAEDLVSDPKKRNELEGIFIEAKILARKWRNPKNRRPLLGADPESNTNVLLAALVVALRPYYELLEPILRHAPNELDHASFVARMRLLDEVRPGLAAYLAGLPRRTAKQKYEHKRRFSFSNRFRSIEYEFGRPPEAERWKQLAANLPPLPPLDLGTSTRYQVPRTLDSERTCLDDIFAGQTVNMQRLEELFGTHRHRLLQVIHDGHKPPYNYLDVLKILRALLNEPRKSPKKSTAGRPARPRWLNDADLRTCVLSGIQARIKKIADLLPLEEADLSKLTDRERGLVETVFERFRGYAEWEKEIMDPYLDVVRRHLPDSGKK